MPEPTTKSAPSTRRHVRPHNRVDHGQVGALEVMKLTDQFLGAGASSAPARRRVSSFKTCCSALLGSRMGFGHANKMKQPGKGVHFFSKPFTLTAFFFHTSNPPFELDKSPDAYCVCTR